MESILRPLLEDGRVHLLDGAMGTLLFSRGVFLNVCYDELNLTQPGLVEQIHREYRAAGAEMIETNTFGANPVKLSSHRLAEQTEEVNRAAALIARKAVGVEVPVLGAIGPLGVRVEPFGPTAMIEAQELFGRQIDGLVEGGADGLLFETFSDLNELGAGIEAGRRRCNLPILALMTVGRDGNTTYGHSPGWVAQRLTDLGVDALGLNCSVGPAVMLDSIEEMAGSTSLPLCALPNAGFPRMVGDRQIYLASPEYMTQYARRMADAGARILGGCCGTTPEHIHRMAEGLTGTDGRSYPGVSMAVRADERAGPQIDPSPLEDRSGLGGKLASGSFVISIELTPPRGWDPSVLTTQAEIAQNHGVDAVSIPDAPRGQARMGALPASLLVQNRVGVETILHYSCRNRTMLGMISDLLGAAASGLKNLLLVTGDPPTLGPYPDGTQVFDIDSIGLTNVVAGLNCGHGPGGSRIGEPTEFVVGVAANQGAADIEREIGRFHWKVDAGADFAVTQPVFDPEGLASFLEKTKDDRIPTIAGIWPLTSLKNAEFLANEVPGVSVPTHMIERMRKAEASGHGAEEGAQVAREMIEAVRPLVQGIHLTVTGDNIIDILSLVDL